MNIIHNNSFFLQKIIKNFNNNNIKRILKNNFPRMVYRIRNEIEKTCLHWGQRKLLISEIEFLTKYSRKNDTILYIGAAPGIHINILIHLYVKKDL